MTGGAQVCYYDLGRRGSSLYTAALLSLSHGLRHYVSICRSLRKVQGQQCFRARRHRATLVLLIEVMSSFTISGQVSAAFTTRIWATVANELRCF